MASEGFSTPPLGFYFRVEFSLTVSASSFLNVNNLANTVSNPGRGLGLPNDNDSRSSIEMGFQEVGGLTATVGVKELPEGGENRFKHALPDRVTYSKLTLKRGLITDSSVLQWCINAISNFEFKPITIFVKLLDENHQPLVTWEVVNAYPVKWSVSNFNAEQNSIVVESMELAYQYFNYRL
jgi:phage tail-like protein